MRPAKGQQRVRRKTVAYVLVGHIDFSPSMPNIYEKPNIREKYNMAPCNYYPWVATLPGISIRIECLYSNNIKLIRYIKFFDNKRSLVRL